MEKYFGIDGFRGGVNVKLIQLDFLEKMFEWGVIGNSGARMGFKFLGDRDLAPTDNMIIHTPLRNFFAVKSRK